MVAGIDLGDKYSHICMLERGTCEVSEECRVRTTAEALRRRFAGIEPLRIAMETGLHSPWVSRLLEELGHEVYVANANRLRLIYENKHKSDKVDAEYLARVAAADPKLLHPVDHRSERTQADLTVMRSRDLLVEARTKLINLVRGSVKSMGGRLASCSTECFDSKAPMAIPDILRPALLPVVETIGMLTERIRSFDEQIERMCTVDYPETARLRAVKGVGPLTALHYVLTIEDPHRFETSRKVGVYVGLTPGKKQSSGHDPQCHITKQGSSTLRRLLVNAGHYILGPFGEDCDLRRYGERITQTGNKTSKKKAVVAVARKLAVLLHHLWVTGDAYDPFHNDKRKEQAA
jgi:transposase